MSDSVHDVIIIGGGIAGLFCALKLSPRPVTVVTAAPIGRGASSAWAQGGIAAAVAEGDTPEAHARDTITAGAGLVDEEMARVMTREAPERVRDLLAYGVSFDRTLDGRLAVGREAAHSARRIVHVRGDGAGRAIMDALVTAVRKTPSIRLLEGYEAEELVTDGPRVVGVRARPDDRREVTTLSASAIVLATGGIGHLYAVTTNPPQACGIGLAIAARAGAVLADPEFVQFHPTAIAIGRDPAPLASEALRGDGAILVNGAGERFMLGAHPDGDLAPRDVVARGVFAEIAAGRGAFLDARAAIGKDFPERFPTVYASCMTAGIDPVHMPIPVAPAAHYHMGGVSTDARGRTSLAGLWAAGEVASTGVHGANRLASNSLLEAVVFAARVAEDISGMSSSSPAPQRGVPEFRSSLDAASHSMRDLRTTMSQYVGVIRDEGGLATAVEKISHIERETSSASLRNMATAALVVSAAAFARHESRGAHYRSDYPRPDPALARRTFLTFADVRTIAAEATHASHGVKHPMRQSLLCPDAFLSPLEIDDVVTRALVEDLGRAGDVTSIATIPEDAAAHAIVVARKPGIIAGLPLVAAVFRKLAAEVAITPQTRDGASVATKTALMHVTGPARAVLAAERVALNLLGHLSGVATATHEFVRRVKGTRTRICCTRKTTPGLRALEKYAVRCGGGFNNRFGLDDAMFIKDNHIAVAGSIRAVLERARASAGHLVKIEIEVDSLDQLGEVLAVGLADAVLLDNMNVTDMSKAVAMVGGRFPLEASGGITLESIAAVASTGVDYASSGWITLSAPNLDVALDIEI